MNTESFQNQILFKILITLSVCVYFLPELGAHDRIGPQFAALSIINIITFSYLIYIKKSFSFLGELFSNKIILFYSLFLFFSIVSIIKSQNIPESIITFSNYFSVFFCFLNLIILNSFLINPRKFFIDLIFLLFLAEVLLSFYPMLKDLFYTGNILARSNTYIGAAANVNVTSFSIAFKLPFLIYYIETRKKLFSKILLLALLMISFFVIIILNSRGAFIATFLVIGIYFFSIFIINNKSNFKTKFVKIFYISLPLIFSIFISNSLLSGQTKSTFYNRSSTISLSTDDGSVNQRLRFYKQALTSISNNLSFGVGIGNWKLVSIAYDSKDIKQYIIPYHAHNDFLQVASESGIFALIFYIFIFIFILLNLYNLYLKDRKDLFYFLTFSSILVYIFDSLFNFPIARPINQLSLIFVFALIINLNQSKKRIFSFNKFHKILILSILLVFSSTSIYSSYKNFVSLKDQSVLYSDYNGWTKILSTENLHLVQESFPSLTATVLPINELKANYFIQEGKHKEAIELLRKKNLNPYLGFRENLMVQAFKGLKERDSVLKYIKRAFEKLPNSDSHSTQYLNELRKRKDLDEINNTFKKIKNKSPMVWKAYLNAKSEVVGPGNNDMKKTIDSLIKVYPNDTNFSEIRKFILIGKKNFAKALASSVIAEDYFKREEYDKAVNDYLKAIKLDPYEYSYHENLAFSYQKLGDTKNAYKHFNIVIDSLNPKTGKSEFYKAVNLLKDKELEEGCYLLKKSFKYGFSAAKNVSDEFCN